VSGELAGRTAVVTGAGRGIGRAIVLRLSRAGACVACLDRDGAAAEDAAAAAGGGAVGLACDVADEASVAAAVSAVLVRTGRIDVLVNNAAAVTRPATVDAIPLADWREALAVNLTGVFLASRAVVPAMAAAGGGSIVHVASQLGSVGQPGRAAYCATKAAVIQLARVMALDHAAQGIRVNSLSPGPTWTERIGTFFPDRASAEAALAPAVPLGRLAEPDEIADAALFLASDASRFVTGSDLVVDGGYLAR